MNFLSALSLVFSLLCRELKILGESMISKISNLTNVSTLIAIGLFIHTFSESGFAETNYTVLLNKCQGAESPGC